MIDVDEILKDGAERRERAVNRRKLLEDLRGKVGRKKWIALPCIVGFGFYFWLLSTEFLSDESMSKSDFFSLLHYTIMCGWLLYIVISTLYVDRRDLFLIELLEKELANEKSWSSPQVSAETQR